MYQLKLLSLQKKCNIMDKNTLNVDKELKNHITQTKYTLSGAFQKVPFFDIDTFANIKELYLNQMDSLFFRHDFYVIILPMIQTGMITIDLNDYPIADNMIYFLSPNNVVSNKQFEFGEGIVICVSNAFLDHLDFAFQNKIRRDIFNSPTSVPRCVIPKDKQLAIRQHVVNMMDVNNIDFKFSNLKTTYQASLFTMFMIDAINFGIWENVGIGQNAKYTYDVVRTFLNLVEQNYKKWHSVQDYLQILSVSQTTLGVYTKRHFGVSPLKIIHTKILVEAKRMVSNTTRQLKSIADELGFEDVSYFARFFKRNVGVTPDEFRKTT